MFGRTDRSGLPSGQPATVAADDLRSTVIVSDVTAEGPSDTHLEILLEHCEYAMHIHVPYVISDAETFDLRSVKAVVEQQLLWG